MPRPIASTALLVVLAAGCRSASGDGAAASTAPAPAPAVASSAATQPAAARSPVPAADGGLAVVLKNGQRLPATKPPVVALGRVIYESADGAKHAIALDLVDLAATRAVPMAEAAVAPEGRPAGAPRMRPGTPGPSAADRRPAPEFEAVGRDGKPVKLSDLKGKVVLVDFWATWCGPCVQEMPNVKRAHESLEKRGFKVLGVSLDHDRARLDAYVKANDLAWPQQFDGQGWGNEVARKYGVQSIPHTVLVDRNGRIARIGVRGPTLTAAIEELLAEKG
jgi:peroxiredoxin